MILVLSLRKTTTQSLVPTSVVLSLQLFVLTLCKKFHQLLAVGRWFPPGTPVSSTR